MPVPEQEVDSSGHGWSSLKPSSFGDLGVKEFGCLLVSGFGSVRIEFRAGFLDIIYIYMSTCNFYTGVGLKDLRLHYIYVYLYIYLKGLWGIRDLGRRGPRAKV